MQCILVLQFDEFELFRASIDPPPSIDSDIVDGPDLTIIWGDSVSDRIKFGFVDGRRANELQELNRTGAMMMMERRIKLRTLNSHITCKICRGYLIDATTVTECLHTFCKSCLVKHLEENNTCPTCHIVIHQSHPLQYISFDRTMQDIVYKLVPNLQQNEIIREREFYRLRGLPFPKDVPLNLGDTDDEDLAELYAELDYHRLDEQVNICLECISSSLHTLNKKFLRLSAQATILHLKKFVAKKVLQGMDLYRDIDILCNDELLGKDHTLKFVCVTRWRFQSPPLLLQYRPHLDL